jgi:hypothetical protein
MRREKRPGDLGFVVLLSALVVASLVAPAAMAGPEAQVASQAQKNVEAPLLRLPSGKAVSRTNYVAGDDADVLNAFRPFYETSKIHYLENPDESGAKGSHYRDVLAIRARAKASGQSPAALLTDMEIAAVVGYTEKDYYRTNGYLWRDQFEDDKHETALLTEAKALFLHSALNKLPVFKKAVIRGDGFPSVQPQDPAKEWEETERRFNAVPEAGGTYVFKGFMSTTRGEGEYARHAYVDNAKMHTIIEESKSGRLIEEISTKPLEEEVLFSPRTEFVVLKKEIVKVTPTAEYPFDHRFVVHLREK